MILVVEDERAVCEVIEEALARECLQTAGLSLFRLLWRR